MKLATVPSLKLEPPNRCFFRKHTAAVVLGRSRCWSVCFKPFLRCRICGSRQVRCVWLVTSARKELLCDEVKRPNIEFVLHEIWIDCFFAKMLAFRALAVLMLRLLFGLVDMSSAFRCSDEVRFFWAKHWCGGMSSVWSFVWGVCTIHQQYLNRSSAKC